MRASNRSAYLTPVCFWDLRIMFRQFAVGAAVALLLDACGLPQVPPVAHYDCQHLAAQGRQDAYQSCMRLQSSEEESAAELRRVQQLQPVFDEQERLLAPPPTFSPTSPNPAIFTPPAAPIPATVDNWDPFRRPPPPPLHCIGVVPLPPGMAVGPLCPQ